MDDISGVTASKVRHGNSDLLVVVGQVDADIFLQLLAATQRGVHRVFIKDPAVEQVLLGDLHTNAPGVQIENTSFTEYSAEFNQALREV